MKTPLFIDTHCHVHASEFAERMTLPADEQLAAAKDVGVEKVVCVGTDVLSSREAIDFCNTRPDCFAAIALHPHEAANSTDAQLEVEFQKLRDMIAADPAKVIAIGECGLDYYYHSDEEVKNRQKRLLRLHIELAVTYEKPLIFHIRDAFDDFFEIFDACNNLRGVVHSFSAGISELTGVINRGLYVGLNGIMTFSKQIDQLAAAKTVPLESLVLETDAPFLTPAPFRGKMCEPKHVVTTASFLSDLRGENLEDLAQATTANAIKLFGI